MSNKKVKRKSVRHNENSTISVSQGWILLAEDAERNAAKARERSNQFLKAARIFKENAENGVPFPQDLATQK